MLDHKKLYCHVVKTDLQLLNHCDFMWLNQSFDESKMNQQINNQ